MQRGHNIVKFGSYKEIFAPQDDNPQALLVFEDILYNLMMEDSFRAGLRNWAFDNKNLDKKTQEKVDSYIKKCYAFNLSEEKLEKRQKRYGQTFEWFISQVIKREFGAKTSGFGIRLKDANPNDEFDCLAILDGGIFYAECKTGKSDIKNEIKKFAQRDTEVCGSYSMLIVDRKYIFTKDKSKDDIPKLKKSEAIDLGILDIFKVKFKSKKLNLFRIDAVENRYFFVLSAMKNMKETIRYVIKYINSYQEGQRNPAGYNIEKIPYTDGEISTRIRTI